MVEGEVRAKNKSNLIEIVNIVSQKLFGFVPDDLTIEFEPLRMLTHEQEENVKNQQQSRILNLYDRQLMTVEETISAHNNEALVGSTTVDINKEVEEEKPDELNLDEAGEETHKTQSRTKFEPPSSEEPKTVKDPDSEYGKKKNK